MSIILSIQLGLLVGVILLAYNLCRRRFTTERLLPLPPGPKRIPFLGNVHQMPFERQHIKFSEWASHYGDLIYLQAFHKPLLVIDTLQTANELLEKRSAKYSSRPHTVVLTDFIGWDATMALLPYGDTWRMHKKWFLSSFREKTLPTRYQLQCEETRRLVIGFLDDPNAYMSHIKRFASAISGRVAYGATLNDRLNRLMEDLLAVTVEAGAISATLFDFLPFLPYMPSWLPVASKKARFTEYRPVVRELQMATYKHVEKDEERSSFVGSLFEEAARDEKNRVELERQAIGAGIQLFGATVDTTTAVVSALLLAMVLHPEVCRKAQKEIDEVLGNSRLPDFSDRPLLPYLECLIRETYRWRPPVPLATVHLLICDDEYRGYRIPKDTIVIPNVWSMSRNAALYPDPERFYPERFEEMDELTRDSADPRRYIFGFGRRTCPGRHFADASVWIIAASLLSVFDIGKAHDAAGQEITPSGQMEPGLISHPEPFVCEIRPRSSKAVGLINQMREELAM
ncbi:cytochrome P450 [Wolfiporia cocos MD-104 SS10]|uniref:Cytochrome P450 n=1 Tax=Wolfiporia cocos (strain MD-104) TaxID=742152 RepID=A0A2H3J980_WOLCO|nr:cytochrome P450 [Wolfiporia cocos MD-104 SS10]